MECLSLRNALEQLLTDVENLVGHSGAYGYPVEDPQHPFHETVLEARAALKAFKEQTGPSESQPGRMVGSESDVAVQTRTPSDPMTAPSALADRLRAQGFQSAPFPSAADDLLG